MNRSYSKIRYIQQANVLLEQRVFGEGVTIGQVTTSDVTPTSGVTQNNEIKEDENVQTLINKVATEGIKNVTTQMISSPQFKGSYSGYQFGGVFNGVNYQWDCNGVEGMSGIRGMVDGEILTETVENMLSAIKKPVTDAKPGSLCVGFYAPASKFIIYTNTSNKPMCLNF